MKLILKGYVVAALTLLAVGVGCGGGQEEESTDVAATTGGPQTSGAETSAQPDQQPQAGQPTAQAEQPLSGPEAVVQRINECQQLAKARDERLFSRCYSEESRVSMVDSGSDVTGVQAIKQQFYQPWWAAFPDFAGETQLLLVNGNKVAGIHLGKGTHTGPLAGPQGTIQPTNKPVAILGVLLTELGPTGRVVSEQHYVDMNTLMGQLGVSRGPHRPLAEPFAEKPVVTASGSETETANLALVQQGEAAFNEHKVDPLVNLFADNVVLHDMTMPADTTGKRKVKTVFRDLFKGFPDIRSTPNAWAAGDYVVNACEITGTHKGRFMGMRPTQRSVTFHAVEIYRIQDGKIVEMWWFANGAAIAAQLSAPAQQEG